MVFAVLLAAGSGTRMKTAKIPKQFLELGGEPILRLTVDKFLACPVIDKVLVAVPSIWTSHARDLLRDPRFAEVGLCEGGAHRQESLYKAVCELRRRWGAADSDVVVSHDVVRPFVSYRIIEDNVAAMEHFDAADTVIPSTDTIVESSDGESVTQIRNRKFMHQGQTPQTFRCGDFIRTYEKVDEAYLHEITDAARLLQENGFKVGLVRGEEYNVKITTEYDLRIARCLLDCL